jgi:hypothetical protein
LAGRTRGELCVLAVVATLLCFAAPVNATFPGTNGGFAYSFELDYETDDVSFTVYDWRVGVVDQDGDNRRFLIHGAEPAFSAGGAKLAVSVVGGGGPRGLAGWGLRVLPLSGKPITALTPGIDRAPAWSPSGRRLAFERGRCTGISETEYCPRLEGIWIVGRGGGKPRRLTSRGHEPAWSSKNEIAFVFYKGDYSEWHPTLPAEIRVIDPKGGEARPLTAGLSPDWSPSGEQLAFVSQNGKGLFIVDRDGTGLRRIHYSLEWGDLASPTWSPDGRRIAFLDDDYGVGAVPAQGGRPRRLFSLGCPPRFCDDGSTADFTDLAWQPLPRGSR